MATCCGKRLPKKRCDLELWRECLALAIVAAVMVTVVTRGAPPAVSVTVEVSVTVSVMGTVLVADAVAVSVAVVVTVLASVAVTVFVAVTVRLPVAVLCGYGSGTCTTPRLRPRGRWCRRRSPCRAPAT